MRKSSKIVLAGVMPLLVASVAQATFTLPAFTPDPSQVSTTWRSQDLVSLAGGSVPGGPYVSATVLVDWVGGGINSQWSGEARAQLASAAGSGTGTQPTVPAGTTVYAAATSPVNGASNGNNVTDLRFNLAFGSVYLAGSAPLFLNFRQTFAGTNANWTNVRVTLNPLVIPSAEQAFLGGSIETSITGPQIRWYTFEVAEAGSYNFNTTGSTLVAGGVLDTEIAIYSAAGTRLAENDDFGGLLTSSITIDLNPGTYYLSAGLFNTTFNNFFVVSSSASPTLAGNLIINGLVIPEPAALGLLAPVAVLAMRRRRA